jgi:hypothetical protein
MNRRHFGADMVHLYGPTLSWLQIQSVTFYRFGGGVNGWW